MLSVMFNMSAKGKGRTIKLVPFLEKKRLEPYFGRFDTGPAGICGRGVNSASVGVCLFEKRRRRPLRVTGAVRQI
jgi:hypothetical protein